MSLLQRKNSKRIALIQWIQKDLVIKHCKLNERELLREAQIESQQGMYGFKALNLRKVGR